MAEPPISPQPTAMLSVTLLPSAAWRMLAAVWMAVLKPVGALATLVSHWRLILRPLVGALLPGVTMVPAALAVARPTPLVGVASVTAKASLDSAALSPAMGSVMVCLLCPGPKVTVPEGSLAPTKSPASAGLEPMPATVQLAEVAMPS